MNIKDLILQFELSLYSKLMPLWPLHSWGSSSFYVLNLSIASTWLMLKISSNFKHLIWSSILTYTTWLVPLPNTSKFLFHLYLGPPTIKPSLALHISINTSKKLSCNHGIFTISSTLSILLSWFEYYFICIIVLCFSYIVSNNPHKFYNYLLYMFCKLESWDHSKHKLSCFVKLTSHSESSLEGGVNRLNLKFSPQTSK